MKIFYSYNHKDEKYRQRLEDYLCTLKNSGRITDWCDRRIISGDDWDEKILKAMEEADVFLLLITQNYIASSSCRKEMDYAFENKKRIIPIIVSPCTWKETDLGRVQAVPKDGKPVTMWQNEDEAWLDVFNGIALTINHMNEKPIESFVLGLNKIEFFNADKEDIGLTDLFVEPDFEMNKVDGKTVNTTFDFDSFVSAENKYCVITGEECSGKTSVLRFIFINAEGREFHPVYFDSSRIYKTINFDQILRQSLKEQYGFVTDEDFRFKKNKVLLVDSFSHSNSDSLIIWAKEHFDYIYVAIDNDEYMLYFKDNPVFADYNQALIRPLNSSKRYSLINKWKSFGAEKYESTEMYQNSIDNLERNVDSIIINQNIVPNTPFYVLTIIQSYESFMPSNLEITAYGHCYQALIVAQLVRSGIDKTQIDDCINYLTYIAGFIFENSKGSGCISKENYRVCKEQYHKEYLIKNSLLARLESDCCIIFKEKNGTISFSYPFIYFYFLGRYLVVNSKSDEIEKLCDKIYLKDYANILVFTIHHSIDLKILEEIELHCMTTLDNEEIAQLSVQETSFMNDLITALKKDVSLTRSSDQNRTLLRKQRDEIELQSGESSQEAVTDTSSSEIKDIERSLRIIEVIGQIVKNRSGSFKKQTIKELMCSVEELSLRVLHFFLQTLKQDDLISFLHQRISHLEMAKGQEFTPERINRIVERTVQVMGFFFILGMIRKTYYCLSVDKVVPLQKEISEEKDIVPFDMYNLFFQLDYKGLNFDLVKAYWKKYEESNNYWAKGVLRILVDSYLNTHTVRYDVRQKICSLLALEYTPNKPLN